MMILPLCISTISSPAILWSCEFDDFKFIENLRALLRRDREGGSGAGVGGGGKGIACRFWNSNKGVGFVYQFTRYYSYYNNEYNYVLDFPVSFLSPPILKPSLGMNPGYAPWGGLKGDWGKDGRNMRRGGRIGWGKKSFYSFDIIYFSGEKKNITYLYESFLVEVEIEINHRSW